MIPEYYQPLIDILWESDAITLDGSFTLKTHEEDPTAPSSPIYINLRDITCASQGLSHVVAVFSSALADLPPSDLIAGVPEAIIPVVSHLITPTRPMLIPRLEKKVRGTKTNISGKFKPGQTVILIDDVVTTAASLLMIIKMLEAEGLIIEHVLVLVDREQGGTKRLKKEGYKLHSVFKLSDLLKYFLNKGWIDQNTYKRVATYIKANQISF